jgi:hypothetical protein
MQRNTHSLPLRAQLPISTDPYRRRVPIRVCAKSFFPPRTAPSVAPTQVTFPPKSGRGGVRHEWH